MAFPLTNAARQLVLSKSFQNRGDLVEREIPVHRQEMDVVCICTTVTSKSCLMKYIYTCLWFGLQEVDMLLNR